MNQTIESILNHRSIRSYTNQPIQDATLDSILACAQAAPSSINGQQMSVIVVKDQKTKDQIAELTGGQSWISQAPVFLVFVADFYRAKLASDLNNQELVLTNNVESTLVASVDTGLAMGNTIAAAESVGLGTVCIGGIRNAPDKMIELLNLPEYTFPLSGLCLGYYDAAQAPDKKPRFPKEAVIHNETYNHDLTETIKAFDTVITEYMAARPASGQTHDWSGFMSGIYSSVYFPKVSPVMKSQKFFNE